MPAEVKLTLAARHDGNKPGDSITVDVAEAKRLVRAGVAVPANVTAEKAIEPDAAKR